MKINYLTYIVTYIISNILIIRINSIDKNSNIKVLACAAVNKKMLEIPQLVNKFDVIVKKFKKRINHDDAQTQNFVNLLLLNKCNNDIDLNLASKIIKERAETGSISDKYISVIDLDNTWDNYISLTDEDKKILFSELSVVKETLKDLTDSMNSMGGDNNYRSNNINNNIDKDNSNNLLNSPGYIISEFINMWYNILISFIFYLYDNTAIIAGILIISLISVLSNVKVRRKKIIQVKKKDIKKHNTNN